MDIRNGVTGKEGLDEPMPSGEGNPVSIIDLYNNLNNLNNNKDKNIDIPEPVNVDGGEESTSSNESGEGAGDGTNSAGKQSKKESNNETYPLDEDTGDKGTSTQSKDDDSKSENNDEKPNSIQDGESEEKIDVKEQKNEMSNEIEPDKQRQSLVDNFTNSEAEAENNEKINLSKIRKQKQKSSTKNSSLAFRLIKETATFSLLTMIGGCCPIVGLSLYGLLKGSKNKTINNCLHVDKMPFYSIIAGK